MNWYLYKDSEHPSGIRIKLTPENEVISFCIATITLEQYAYIIINIANSLTTGREFVHFHFYNDMDWESQDLAKYMVGRKIKEGEIFIRHNVIGATIIEEEIFDKIIYSIACALLDYYGNSLKIQQKYEHYWNWYDSNNPMFVKYPIWKDAMQAALNRLMEKLNNTM